MTASCRQQLATLKLKNSSNSETTNKSESAVTEEAPVKTVQQPEIICETNFTAQDNPAPGINKSQGVFHNGLKVSIEVSQVDSGINIGCSYNETWEGVSKQSEDVPFSHTAHFLVHDFNTDATENHITAIQQVTASTNTESQGFDEDVKTEGEQTNSTCSAIPENLNASITVQIIDEDKSLKTTSSIDVTPAEPPDPDSSSVPKEEVDPSNSTAGGSRALTPPSTFDAVSDCDQPTPGSDAAADDFWVGGTNGHLMCMAAYSTYTIWTSLFIFSPHRVIDLIICDCTGGCQKKRTCSESSHVPDSKRAKTSANTLDEIQCLIDSRVNKIFEDAFDQRMQALTRQADLIRRNMNHTDDITRHLRSIRRLERHLKYAVNFQKQISSGSTKVTPISSSSEEVNLQQFSFQLCSTVEAPRSSTVLPPPEVAESHPRTPPAQDPTASSTELVVLSDNESEEPSNPKQSQKEHRKSSSKKVDPAAMQKIMESIKEHRKKAHSSRANKPVKAVIDLTDDEGQKSDKDSTLVSGPCIPNGDLAALATSSKESSVENVFNKYSVEKGPPSSNRNEASSSDVTADRQSATIPDSSKSKHKSHPTATSSKESSVENIFDKYSVGKGPPSSNHNEASSSDVTEVRQSATIPDSSKSKAHDQYSLVLNAHDQYSLVLNAHDQYSLVLKAHDQYSLVLKAHDQYSLVLKAHDQYSLVLNAHDQYSLVLKAHDQYPLVLKAYDQYSLVLKAHDQYSLVLKAHDQYSLVLKAQDQYSLFLMAHDQYSLVLKAHDQYSLVLKAHDQYSLVLKAHDKSEEPSAPTPAYS
ncbi:unnamed protein product [Ranitomeya imitator]|uniref:Uncharacterized protein n=1 Tax=Ranitomeya imitator TaxID=111125 RepID=A0ABN9LDN2_9NEOB|nr:unnamed protein product [Ranitomeya imitator]